MDDSAARSRAHTLHRQGRDLEARGQLPAARDCYRQALELAPDHPQLLHDLAQLSARSGDIDTAVTLLHRLVDSRPDSGLEGLLALFLTRQSRDEEAIPYLRRHLRTHPADDKAWLVLAQCFLHRQQWTSALQCAAEADKLAPSERALDIALECLSSLGLADEVETCVQEALRRYPDSHAILAHYGVHLHRQGRIREGLKLQPMIRKRFSPRRPGDRKIAAHQWDGKRFDGLLLVSAEQGIGEEILGSSFFTLLAASGQPAVIECDPRLIPIFARSFPGLRFLPPGPDNQRMLGKDGTVVRRIKTLDLATLLAGEGEFVQSARWLHPDPSRVAAIRAGYRQRWPGKFLVGVSWRSVREMHGSQWKTIPLESLLPVLALPDVVAIDVQYGGTEEERQLPARHGLPPLHRDAAIDPMLDLDGLLAQLCALDSLVTISNTTAHLAGAAGVAGHVILPGKPPVYVYWGYDGERTPMYPSLHLWRPARFANLEALTTALAGHIAGLVERKKTEN